jgi:hypothetical protein
MRVWLGMAVDRAITEVVVVRRVVLGERIVLYGTSSWI